METAKPVSKQKIGLLESMLRIRLFEEEIIRLIGRGEMEIGFHLLMGHEASTVGVCSDLRAGDYITSNHRTLGRYLARGAPMNGIMAEIFGRSTGICGGKAGEMLIADKRYGYLFSSVTVGAGIPVAVGTALALGKRNSGRVVVSFFGEAATCNAPFHESVNLAAVHKAPVIFACENNGYSINVPSSELSATATVAEKAAAYDIPGIRVDGTDVEEVQRRAREAIDRARDGMGPTLLDIVTVRLRPHKEGLADTRSKEEIEACKRRDPVLLYTKRLRSTGVLTSETQSAMKRKIRTEVADAVEYAKRSPYPEASYLYRDLYDESIAEKFKYSMS